jgi:presenilin-like A22 family membrane protease
MNHIARIVAMFLLAQFIGLFVGIQLIGDKEYTNLNVTPNQQSGDAGNSIVFLLYVVAVAVVVVLVIKYFKWAAFLFKALELVTIFITSSLVFLVFLAYLHIPNAFEISIVFSILLVALKFFYPKVKNATAIISSSAVGALFGFSFDIVPTLLFIILISLYDFISVFITRHMVYMAKEMSKMDLSFSISSKEKRYVREKGKRKEEEFSVELGSGDIAIPLMLAVSAYRSFTIVDSLAVILGTTVGLAIVLYYVTTRRVFLPALPPLCFSGLLFLALSQLLGLSRLLLH